MCIADMVATLYGAAGVTMNQTLPEEYTSVLQADGIDDNTLLHIKNTHEGTSLNAPAQGRKGASSGSNAGAGTTSNAARLGKLQAALGAKLYLLVWYVSTRCDFLVCVSPNSGAAQKTHQSAAVTAIFFLYV